MSGAGPQLARPPANVILPNGRRSLAHLLHALNQPLTGLQCSLELAAAGPRPTEYYLRTLREGLELTGRMRVLVEAVRELADLQQSRPEEVERVLLDALLRGAVDDLRPVAETKNVLLSLSGDVSLPVRGDGHALAALTFRFLESALSATRDGGDLQIAATRERDLACLLVSWSPGPPPQYSPFSQPELGLLIAQAGWEQAGAEWIDQRTDDRQTCTIRLPLACDAHGNRADWEI